LGAAVCVHSAADERKLFLAALRRHKLGGTEWVQDEAPTRAYPAHGIRRQLTRIHVAKGDISAALSMLGKLRALNREGIAVDLVYAAALTEFAALVWESDRKVAKARLSVDGKGRDSAFSVLGDIQGRLPAGLDELHALVGGWRSEVQKAHGGEIEHGAVPVRLTAFARRVGY